MPNCENNDKIHQTFVFLIILGTIVLALMVISSSNLSSNVVFAQHLHRTLHNNTLYEVVKQASGSGEIPHIDVGSSPEGVAVNENTNTVYVANTGSDTISVISGENNTKIGEDIPVGDYPIAVAVNDEGILYFLSILEDIPEDILKDAIDDAPMIYVANAQSDTISVISGENNTKIGEDIPVGDYPIAVAVNEDNPIFGPTFTEHIPEDIPEDADTIYVANADSDTISVISGENNTKIGEDIPVGDFPIAVAVNENTNTVYVAHHSSNTISVISRENNTKIGEDIPVGVAPVAIDINEFSDIVYVANVDSDNVSVIDPVTNKVVAGITFHVNPFNSGVILCDDLTTPSPVGQYVYVYAGARCIAEPNTGFEFSSWEENNLKDNSTQPISISRPAPLLDSFFEFFSSKSPNKLEPDTLNVTKFGTFTANFREIPPTIPLGFWFALFTTIAGSITAAFFGALFGQRRKNN